jgi:hypothetical protein
MAGVSLLGVTDVGIWEGGRAQGVESVWDAIVNSIEPSPPAYIVSYALSFFCVIEMRGETWCFRGIEMYPNFGADFETL